MEEISPRDNDACMMLQIICILQLKFEHFNKTRFSPLPTQCNIQTQEKLQIAVFNIACREEASQLKLYSRLACVQKRPN